MGLTEGEVVAGKYRIIRRLGEGGMGTVYVALNERLNKEVALKILSEDMSANADISERFVREAMAASRAKHPGVVEIFDADADGDVLWIAMELLGGESLAERLARGSLPPHQAVTLVTDVVAALAAVHEVGVIHRDLKPANIFIERLGDGSEQVKILDFGIAKMAAEGLGKVTKTGTTVGTPDYFAPEQAMGRADIDGRVDIHAVGVILFEAIAGQLPYDAETFGELVAKMLQEGPKRLSMISPNVPAQIAQLVDRCLAVDPAGRPQSARVLRDELRALHQGMVAPTAASHPIALTVPAQPVAPRLPATAPIIAHPMIGATALTMTPPESRSQASVSWKLLVGVGMAGFIVVSVVIVIVVMVFRGAADTPPVATSEQVTPMNPGQAQASPSPSPAPPTATDGCQHASDCADSLRQRCNETTRECEPAPQWAETILQYESEPQRRFTNCLHCDATIAHGGSVTLRFQQGDGLTLWMLTMHQALDVGNYTLKRRAFRPAQLFVTDSSKNLRARFRGGWQHSDGTISITSADVRHGGHITGSLRSKLVLHGTNPPTKGRIEASFHARFPQ